MWSTCGTQRARFRRISKYRMKQAAASADTGCANNETEDEDEPCTSDQGSRNCLEGAAQPRNVEPTSVQEILPTETEASEPRVSGVGLLASNATLEGNNDDSSDSSSDDTDAETEADGDDAADAPGKEISDLVRTRVILVVSTFTATVRITGRHFSRLSPLTG